MAPTTWGNYPYGCKELKVVNGATIVSALAAKSLKFKDVTSSNVLRGNDKIVATKTFFEAMELELEDGGYGVDFIGALTGRTPVISGTGSAEVSTTTFTAGNGYPYVKLYGKMLGDGTDDLHVKFFKVQVMEIEGSFQEGQFAVTKCKLRAIGDSALSDKVAEIVANETAAALPAS